MGGPLIHEGGKPLVDNSLADELAPVVGTCSVDHLEENRRWEKIDYSKAWAI